MGGATDNLIQNVDHAGDPYGACFENYVAYCIVPNKRNQKKPWKQYTFRAFSIL